MHVPICLSSVACLFSLCNNQHHQRKFVRKADFPSEAQFPRTMAMLTKRINLICGNPHPLALPWQLPGMFKCMLNGFGPGCEDTKLYGSNVQSQGGAGNENGGWRLDAEEEENGRTGMVCTVLYCTGDNVHQLTGLDWASGQKPSF